MKEYRLPYVVVFIPAYNEEKAITGVIEEINQKYVNNPNKDYVLDVIVVDDGSKDKTAEIAKQAGVKWGDGFLAQLSKDLMSEFPDMKGFSLSNIKSSIRMPNWPGI